MPIVFRFLGNHYVLSGHRGEALKSCLPQHKDAAYSDMSPRRRPPATQSRRVPLPTLRKATDYTRLASPKLALAAAESLPQIGSGAEVCRQVRNWIESRLPPPGAPLVVIAGEVHVRAPR